MSEILNPFTPGNYERTEDSPAIPANEGALKAEVKSEIEKLKKEIEGSKKEFITILGIFASFITFTSVDFQLLKNITNIGDYLSLTFLLLAGMLIFVFALKNLITEETDNSFFRKPLFKMIVSLVALSIIVYTIAHWDKEVQNNNSRKEYILDSSL